MPTFYMAPVYHLPSVLPETKGAQYELFKYYGPHPEGQTLIRTAGTLGTNLLTDAQSGFETDTGGWEALGGGNSSVARSTAQARTGVASLAVTSLAAGTMVIQQSETGTAARPISGGMAYIVSTWWRAATVGRTIGSITARWYDSAGVFLSQSGLGMGIADVTTGWTQVRNPNTFPFTSPVNARYVSLQLAVNATGGAGEVHYLDDVYMGTSDADVYRLTTTPTQEELDDALEYWLGGHVHTITNDQATRLTAAGYGAYITY